MPVYWLSDNELWFPHPSLSNDDGIVAVGGDLSAKRLLLAYQHGIFPWFNPGDPILWWSPDPRFVMYPDDLKVSKSMRSYFNQNKFQVTYDQCFDTVMRACMQQKRKGQSGSSWISEEMIRGYSDLHESGYAHSVEVWNEDRLVGGLYGIALGKMFFGESMFALESNASKFGFISLARKLIEYGFTLIDCQQETAHLKSLGAKLISRSTFIRLLEQNNQQPTLKGHWGKIFV